MSITIFSVVCLIGAILGFRFKVQILFPAIGMASLCTAIIGIGRGNGGAEVILTTIAIATALQVGYLVGALVRATVVFSVAPEVRRILARAAGSCSAFRKDGETAQSFHPYAARPFFD